MINQEIPYYQSDLIRILGGVHANTLRKAIKAGRVPKPDVQITQKIRYWHKSSLVKAGLLPAL